MTVSPTAPEVLIGNFSRHFQQYNTPSIVVCAPQELHFRLMLITALIANEPGFLQLWVGIGRTADVPRGRATHFSVANSASSPRRLVASSPRRLVASSLFASDGLNVMTVAFHVRDTHLVSSAKAGVDICDGLTTHLVLDKGDRDGCLGLTFRSDPDR